jgi:hypothetical protein
MLYVSALASREIRALLLALRQAEPEIRKEVNNQSKLAVTSIWKQAIAEEASSSFGRTQRARVQVIANTAKASVGSKGVRLSAATTGRPLAGGLNGKTQWPALEFGATESVRTVRSTSKLGKPYTMERNVHAQLDPRKKTGYLFFPAAKESVPRILSLWVQTAVRTLAEVVERKA